MVVVGKSGNLNSSFCIFSRSENTGNLVKSFSDKAFTFSFTFVLQPLLSSENSLMFAVYSGKLQ